MRASRLVSLLLLLQHRGRITASDLAEELEVSVRTIYRDLEALSAAGVPVYAEPGRNGGCRLVDGYRTRLTGLTAQEAKALFAAGVPGPVGDLGLGTVLGAAQLKLLAALPPDLAERATDAQRRFHVDAPDWYRGGRNDAHLADLAAAVWDDQRVVVLYRRPEEAEPAPRRLDPLGLVCKAGKWYLVARRDGDLRTYRVSRVHEVTRLDERFERPRDFDLARFWAESVAEFEAIVPGVQVLLDATERGVAELSWVVQRSASTLLSEEALADGRARCRVAFESVEDAFLDLIPLGADVEVLEPAELRSRMLETADALRARYGANPSP